MTEYVVLEVTGTPLGGHCPACGGRMDDTGCRVTATADPGSLGAAGVVRVLEVQCMPGGPVTECPQCRQLAREVGRDDG